MLEELVENAEWKFHSQKVWIHKPGGKSWNSHFKQAPHPLMPPVTLMQVGHDLTLAMLQLSVCNYAPGTMLGVQRCKSEWGGGYRMSLECCGSNDTGLPTFIWACSMSTPNQGEGPEEAPIPLDCRQWKSCSELISWAWHRRSKMTWSLLPFPISHAVLPIPLLFTP